MTTKKYDLFADEHKPHVAKTAIEYTIEPRGAYRTSVTVMVDQIGCLDIVGGTWFGERICHRHDDNILASGAIFREVYEWLQEWELAISRPNGPEDREWFATTNLDPDRGEPC